MGPLLRNQWSGFSPDCGSYGAGVEDRRVDAEECAPRGEIWKLALTFHSRFRIGWIKYARGR